MLVALRRSLISDSRSQEEADEGNDDDGGDDDGDRNDVMETTRVTAVNCLQSQRLFPLPARSQGQFARAGRVPQTGRIPLRDAGMIASIPAVKGAVLWLHAL